MRLLRIMLLLGMLCWGSVMPRAAAQTGNPGPTLRPGEIRLEGVVKTVDGARQQIVLNVTSFALPDGRSSKLSAPKSKTVAAAAQTLIYRAPDQAVRLALKDLRVGDAVAAIGTDQGSGNALIARVVEILKESQKSSTVLTAPAHLSAGDNLALMLAPSGRVTEVHFGQDVLLTEGQGGFEIADFRNQPEPLNLVPNGSFEEGTEGWTLGTTQTLDTTMAHSGQASVRLSVAGPELTYSNLEVAIPAKPSTHYRVGMWVRLHGVPPATSSSGPGVFSSILDEAGRPLGTSQQMGPMPTQNDVWSQVGWDVHTLPGTTRLLLRGCLYQTTGTLWLDDFFIHEVKDQVYQPASGQLTVSKGATTFRGDLPGGLQLEATYRPGSDCLRVDGVVGDTTGDDRAVGVRFALPLNLAGWTWWNDAEDHQLINPDRTYSNTYDSESGIRRCSIYPWAAVSSPRAGLSLALPLSQGPRSFIIQHDQSVPQLSVTFFFALAKDAGRNPSSAPFSFVIYPHDPNWGMRSAMERYYSLFPESFVKRPVYEGYYGYGSFERFVPETHELGSGGKSVPDASDFGEGYKAVTHMHGCYDWRQIATEDRSRPTDETVFGWLKQLVAEEATTPWYYTPVAETMKKIVFDSDGHIRYIAEGYETRYWMAHEGYNLTDKPGWGLIFRVNEDPDVSPWLATKHRELLDKYKADNPGHVPFSASLKADAIDGYGSNEVGLDYRREHFRTTLPPLTFGANSLKPAICNTIWDFHHKCWWPLSQQHQVIIHGNGNTPSTVFTMPFEDLVMIEGRWPTPKRRAEERFWRAVAHHKLWRYWCEDPSWYSRPADSESVRRQFRDGLAGAIFPALEALQLSTSNLEPYRVYYRQYLPAIEELSASGWEPVHHGRLEPHNPDVVLERFGFFGDGTLHFTLRNYSKTPGDTVLTLDRKTLGIRETDSLLACDLLPGDPHYIPCPPNGLQVSLDADGSRAFWVGTRAQAASRGLRLAGGILDKIERSFTSELDPTSHKGLADARAKARLAESAARDVQLKSAEDLQQFADTFPQVLKTNSPVDLAKLLLRLRVCVSHVPVALLELDSTAPRTAEDAVRGGHVQTRWQLGGPQAAFAAEPRLSVISPWSDLAARAELKPVAVASGQVGLTATLPVPNDPTRSLLPYALVLQGSSGGVPYTVAVPVDVLLTDSVAFAVEPTSVVRGVPTELTLTATNRLNVPGKLRLQFALPALLGKATPTEVTLDLPASGKAQVTTTVEFAATAQIGTNFLPYTIVGDSPRFSGKGTVPVQLTAVTR